MTEKLYRCVFKFDKIFVKTSPSVKLQLKIVLCKCTLKNASTMNKKHEKNHDFFDIDIE